MQNTLSEGTARAAQLAPSAVTASAVVTAAVTATTAAVTVTESLVEEIGWPNRS